MSIKNLKFKISNIKHLKCTKGMSFNQQFKIKWKEGFRKKIGVYEPLINISKLFKESKKKIYSKCVKCVCIEWCKAYDKTDLSLNDCRDFINDYERNINSTINNF